MKFKYFVSLLFILGIVAFCGCKKETYTITFNPNGGTGTMSAQTFTEGESQVLNLNSYSREGYSFSGWNTTSAGTGEQYSDGQTITITCDMTLYAQWTGNPVIVTFNANGGIGEMASQTFIAGTAQPLNFNTYSREGYSFSGWNTLYDGTGVQYSNGQAITITTDMVLYAQWTSNGSSGGDGGGGSSSISAPTGVSAVVSGSNIYVSWNSVSNAASYKVYWSSSSDGNYACYWNPSNTYIYDNEPYENNYYKVTAVDNNGNESSMSASAYCHYNGGGGGGTSAPSAPTNVSASNVGSASSPQVLISWSSVSDATSYKVYRSSTASGSYSQIGSETSSTSVYDYSPMSGYNYYKVKAVNSAGESPFSSYAYFNNNGGGGGSGTSSPCPPTVSVSGTSSQTVSWTVSTSSGCGTPTSYEVYHQDPCTSQMELMTTTTSRSYSVPSSYINPGVNRYAVKAINSAGSVAGYGTSSEVSLAKPSSFNVQKLGNDGIKFTWSSVAKATGYQVYYSSSANGSYYIWNEYDTPTTEQICSFPGSSGTTYYFKIRAIYSCGTSPVYSDFTTYSSVTF